MPARISVAGRHVNTPRGRCTISAFARWLRRASPTFFFSNSCKNGLLPIILPASVIEQLFQDVTAAEGYRLAIDLGAQNVTTPSGQIFEFDFNPGLKDRLLSGLDDIGASLKYADEIKAYEQRRQSEAPWLFA